MEPGRATINSMESKNSCTASLRVELATLFSDLVRLETELWEMIDRRLRRDHDLPLSWFEPLQVIDRVPNCRVADIAETLSITVGGTSKLVDRIERAGLCSRAPNPDDARSSVLALTRAGRRVLLAARGSFDEELEARLGAAVSPEQLALVASTVRAVRRHLANHKEMHDD